MIMRHAILILFNHISHGQQAVHVVRKHAVGIILIKFLLYVLTCACEHKPFFYKL